MLNIYFISRLTFFRNPNEPRPVSQKWPVFTNEDKQYFRILRDQSANAIGSNLLPSEEHLWNSIFPALLAQTGKAKEKTKSSQEETGYCEKDGGCEP